MLRRALQLRSVHVQPLLVRSQRVRVRAHRAGDGEAMSRGEEHPLTTLLRRERGALLAFLRRRGATEAEAEDVLQAAALKAHAAMDGVRGPAPGRERGWFYRIVKNELVDTRRAERPRADVDELEALPSEEADGAGGACGCATALLSRTLSPETASLVSAVDVRGEPVARAASELGLLPNAASVRLHRARTSLRKALVAACGACCSTFRGASSCTCDGASRCAKGDAESDAPRARARHD